MATILGSWVAKVKPPRWLLVRYLRRVPTAQSSILALLTYLAAFNRWVSASWIAEALAMPLRSVQAALRALERRGWLKGGCPTEAAYEAHRHARWQHMSAAELRPAGKVSWPVRLAMAGKRTMVDGKGWSMRVAAKLLGVSRSTMKAACQAYSRMACAESRPHQDHLEYVPTRRTGPEGRYSTVLDDRSGPRPPEPEQSLSGERQKDPEPAPFGRAAGSAPCRPVTVTSDTFVNPCLVRRLCRTVGDRAKGLLGVAKDRDSIEPDLLRVQGHPWFNVTSVSGRILAAERILKAADCYGFDATDKHRLLAAVMFGVSKIPLDALMRRALHLARNPKVESPGAVLATHELMALYLEHGEDMDDLEQAANGQVPRIKGSFWEAKERWDRILRMKLEREDAERQAFMEGKTVTKIKEASMRYHEAHKDEAPPPCDMWMFEALDMYRGHASIEEIAAKLGRSPSEISVGVTTALRASR